MELREGQTVRGQILDHRYNEVTIQLEPGRQTLTARLSGDIPLSIGQEAQFTVTEDTSGNYVLKYLPEETSVQSDATAQKALSASGLPVTDRNKALVTELMNHRLPIDKQTLQSLLRVALANREASPQTIILMYKNNIPLTPANIKQFEAYQRGTHQLVKDIGIISQNISGLLKQSGAITDLSGNPANPLAGQTLQTDPALQMNQALQANQELQANQVLHMNQVLQANQTPQLNQALQMNQALLGILYPDGNTPSADPAYPPLASSFNPAELGQLSKLFDQLGKENPSLLTELTAGLADKIQNGTLPVNEAAAWLDNITGANSNQEHPLIGPDGTTQGSLTKENLSLITKLMEEYEAVATSSSQLAKVLTPQERLSIAEFPAGLTDLPNARDVADRITQGNITLKELLTFLQEQLPKSDPTIAAKLLQSPEYAKIFEAAFLGKWTLTPDKVADKDSATNLLQELERDLDQLQSLAKGHPSISGNEHLQEPVQNLKENLRFMKDLNEAFTYLQLPVQFKKQNAHTELYVLTRKKALSDKRENLSVLLHLEMSNLGSLNIHLQLSNSKHIQAEFHVENQETATLIKNHLDILTAALLEKAYILQATVADTYTKPDFSKDFIEQSSQENNIKRYTFDVRT